MLHNDKLHCFYFLPSIIKVINSRRLRWAGHITIMGEDRGEGGLLKMLHLNILSSLDITSSYVTWNSLFSVQVNARKPV